MTYDSHDTPRVTVTEAHRLLRDAGAVLIDVREADEFRAGHVPGAHHVPLSLIATADLPGSGPLVLVCRSGTRSRQAAALLAARGVPAVDVTGGMHAWTAQGLPIEGAPGAVI